MLLIKATLFFYFFDDVEHSKYICITPYASAINPM